MINKNAIMNQRELFATMDFLLNHTDETHPATQAKICQFAKEKHASLFGDSSIRRQRIGACLEFLYDVSRDGQAPFVIKMTDGGKYYVEQKYSLSESQIVQILAALGNDKYTNYSDFGTLGNRVLDAFSTEYNRDRIIRNVRKQLRGVKKQTYARNGRLVEKAYQEGKSILVTTDEGDARYRVYTIKERQGKPYALLLPIEPNEGKQSGNFIYAPMDVIPVAFGLERDVLSEDVNKEGRLEELYQVTNKELAKRYRTLGDLMKAAKLPLKGHTVVISFYFNLHNLDVVKRSFEEFFGMHFAYQAVGRSYLGLSKDFLEDLDTFRVFHIGEKNEPKEYGLVNIEEDGDIDDRSFMAWLLSDPYGDGQFCMMDFVDVVKPVDMKASLASFFYAHIKNLGGYLSEQELDEFFDLQMAWSLEKMRRDGEQ